MTLAQTDVSVEVVDDMPPWSRVRPQVPPPRKPPPPEEPDDGWRFDGDDDPTGSRLNNAHLAMLMFLGAETMLFAALVVVFLVFRIEHAIWPPEFLRVPFWLTGCSTLILLSSAFTMRQALRALRRWEPLRAARFLALTAALGGGFLALQGYEWSQLLRLGLRLSSGVYGASFFVLIGCHALHVCSALIWVIVVWIRAMRTEADMMRPLGTSLCSLYWYYVVAVWPVLYTLIYLV